MQSLPRMSSSGADWNPYDVKASWVAVFILLILWWLSFLPLAFYSERRIKTEEGVINTGADEDDTGHKFRKVSRHFRDGLLFLLTAIALDTVADGPYGAINALAWIFTALWIILGILRFVTKWDRVISILAFLDLILIIAIISDAFAHPANVGV